MHIRLVVGSLIALVGVAPPLVAAPLSAVFTYQGQLKVDGAPANGLYDFEFRLFDLADAGAPQGAMVPKNDVLVENGLVTVDLDFGSVFDGNRRWLEVRVRDGASTGAYTPLTPRQELTAAPYALYALSGPGGSGPWQTSGANIFNTNAGNVGIGTTGPASKLDVRGNLTLDPGASPILYLATGVGEQNRYLQLINSPVFSSASGLKAGGILVADSYGYANPGKNELVVKGNVDIGGNAYFGQQTRQMLNLYGTGFGIGIQDAVLYNRSGGAFYWYQGGTHQNATGNAGGGLALLSLDQLGIHFGARLGQFVRLWEDGVNYYGSGVQAGTHYFRTGAQPGDAFAWHKGGVHNDNPRNPGGGQTLMTLDGENGLAVSGNATQAREMGGFVKAMAKVNADGSVARQYSADGGTISAVYDFGYVVTFPFQVDDRFISVTPFHNGSVGWVIANVVVGTCGGCGPNTVVVTITRADDPAFNVANEFYIFVY